MGNVEEGGRWAEVGRRGRGSEEEGENREKSKEGGN